MDSNLQIIQGDAREKLKDIPSASVQMIVTSPPYYGLRDYKVPGQIGLEKTPQEYVTSLVEIFREARRVLRDDGTLWLNLGDSFAGGGPHPGEKNLGKSGTNIGAKGATDKQHLPNLKPKDLIGIPWRVAFALQDDGWYLRQWMPWVKTNAMPESCQDRPSSSCETIFLLTKNADYFYDTAAVRKPPSKALLKQVMEGYNGESTKDFFGAKAQDACGTKCRIIASFRDKIDKQRGHSRCHDGFNDRWDHMTKKDQMACGSQRRNGDWFLDSLRGMMTDEAGAPLAFLVNTASFKEAHFATYPPALVRPCILAGTSAAGCCSKCGAPLEREVEKVETGWNGQEYGERVQDAAGGAKHGGTAKSTLGSPNDTLTSKEVTTDWQPACACNAGKPTPCTILDPFFGSGTTGQVALELGRRCIGIELNHQYVAMSTTRTNVTPGFATLQP